jgi:hypothetical protein
MRGTRQGLKTLAGLGSTGLLGTGPERTNMNIGDKYNWPGQPERLVYLGRNRSGNGYWHQFAKVESPETVWCEVVDADLHMLEETDVPNA